ncbi:MAG: Hpt domain-containing protein [Roseobacter sp.]
MTDSVLDPSVFTELQATVGEDFAAELLDAFFDEAPGMITALGDAQAAGDEDAFRRAAHSIKSNAATFGATQLADKARVLEMGGIQELALVEALSQDYAQAAAALQGLKDA